MSEKIGIIHTEFCALQVRGPQNVQNFPQSVRPLLDEHSHIEYEYFFHKLCMSSVTLVDSRFCWLM